MDTTSQNITSPPIVSLTNSDVNLESFRIYVDDKNFFMLNYRFPWTLDHVEVVDFTDPKNEYCLSLNIVYVLSYLTGIGLKNLNSNNPLAKSLAHFYFHYHIRKLYNYRDFSSYDVSQVKKFSWSLYSWTSKHVWYHPQIKYTKDSLKYKSSDVIDKIHVDGKKVYYKVRGKKRNVSKDYLRLITKDNNGITPLGQQLLQESCQAYVYCVLGAQAKTRWKIVGDSANSLQTQHVFMDLVAEVTKQNNTSTLIDSMRIAISDTRVRLDFCVSPGLELLPSNMVFIKDTPGYNNVLIVSTRKQKFGVNNVNSTLKLIDSSLPNNYKQNYKQTTSTATNMLQTKFEQNLSKNQAKTSSLSSYFRQNSQQTTNNTTSNTTNNLLGDRYVSLQQTTSNTGVFIVAAIVAIPLVYLFK